MIELCQACQNGTKRDLSQKGAYRTFCKVYEHYYYDSDPRPCEAWEKRRGSIIDSDDAYKYESRYCDRCLNKPAEDPPACPAYELLLQYGCVAGQAKEKAVRDILRLFFPPHPTVEGKLDQCRMFTNIEELRCVYCERKGYVYNPKER